MLWFSVILALLLILFGVSFYFLFEKNVYATAQSNLYRIALAVKEQIAEKPDIVLSGRPGFSGQVAILKNDTVIFYSKGLHVEALLASLRKGRNFTVFDNGENLQAVYRLALPDGMWVLATQSNIDDDLEDFVDAMLVIGPLLLFVLVFIANRLIDTVLSPVKEVTRRVSATHINNLVDTVELPGAEGEIRELIDAFNRMFARLKEGVANLDRFNSDVSHELRTPLTVIKGEIDIALRKPRDEAYYARTLQTLRYESEKIEKIIEGLLLLTKFSETNIQRGFEQCALDGMIKETVERMKNAISQKHLQIVSERLEPLKIQGHPELLSALFNNLLDNAIKYSHEGGCITLSLAQMEEGIVFNIKDEGVGIAKEHLPFVAERFYRVDAARSGMVAGFGLGLSIVQKSAVLHHGVLKIESEPGEGTRVRVVFAKEGEV